MQERIEWKWIEAFTETFRHSAVKKGDPVAIVAESQSRRINVELAELALEAAAAVGGPGLSHQTHSSLCRYDGPLRR